MLSKIQVLGSSSDGNAYVLSFDSGKKIQLDAGVKNPNAKDINHCLISHEHIDHNKYEKDFNDEQKKHPYIEFRVPHAVPTKGFYIKHDDEKILYITDCSDWKNIANSICGLDKPTILMVECNWDYFLINDGLLAKESYSDYALHNHMSNLDCLNLIAALNINKDCKIIFLHKSKHHATYDNTYKMFDSLPNKKYIAKEGETLYVKSWKNI